MNDWRRVPRLQGHNVPRSSLAWWQIWLSRLIDEARSSP